MNQIGTSIVTQREVAEAAGVHSSTVSLALRNDPRLLAATREHVRAVAERLGYAPNPLVSLLMSRVRRHNVSYRGTLAFVHTMPAGGRRAASHIQDNYLAGAKQRAEQLGYKLDEFHLPGKTGNPASLTRILHARNIVGVVVLHTLCPGCPDRRLPFDVAAFATAAIGVPLAHPPMHYVANDQYMRPIIAARELLALGYRRPGLVIERLFDVNMAHRCSAGFWAVQHYIPQLKPIPILDLSTAETRGVIGRWLRRYRPDVILASRHWVLDSIRSEGLAVPDDIGYVHLDWLPKYAPAAGVYGNSEHTGAAAVEMVVFQLHRGERGPPSLPANHLIAGSWVPGKTIRPVGTPLNLNSTFFAELSGA